jgi:hypothetical protein
LLKDSVPCPIPFDEKRRGLAAPSSITTLLTALPHSTAKARNKQPPHSDPGSLLQKSHDLGPPGKISFTSARPAARRADGKQAHVESPMWLEVEAPDDAERRGGTGLCAKPALDSALSLLIVPGLFFIHRGAGEVAEWSKALPC